MEVHALRGVDFHASFGELVAVAGPSGCGKTTLLNLLGGLDLPDAGGVQVMGEELSGRSEAWRTALRLRQVGMVFQENNLIAHLTASENVELVLRFQGEPSPVAQAMHLLALVGMGPLAKRRPTAMSGGQRQRVGIARALAGGRSLLLCDEPTGALDSANSTKLFALLSELAHQERKCVVVATHDPLVRECADRVVSMRDGLIVA